MTARDDGARDHPGSSSERSLRLLALLAREGRPMALSDIAQRLSLPKATAHRLTSALLEHGWLARDVDGKHLSVGPALRRIAFDVLNHGDVRGLRHAVLDALVREVGETCNFTTLDGAEVLYLDRVEAHWPLRMTLDVGSHVPLHCTASGKLFLAFLPTARREALLSCMALQRMTARTLVDPDALRSECRTIAARGWSVDDEEYIAGLVAVAVPVRDPAGEVRAALAVHAPSARMTIDAAIARLPALQAAAARMATLL